MDNNKEDERLKELLFPHLPIREIQKDMLFNIEAAIQAKTPIILNAPTGIGKTAAAIAPALSYALKHNLTVFFVTSRHMQHQIAINTLREIKQKYPCQFTAADIIGKKWMCIVPGIENLYSSEFNEYCKAVREDGKCEFYVNTRTKSGKLTIDAQLLLAGIRNDLPKHTEKLVEQCIEKRMCPYEMATELSIESQVIISDYYYIFNPKIRNIFFKKAKKELENSIIIVDEAHNLPARIRELMTQTISTVTISRAIAEARKFGYKETMERLKKLNTVFEGMQLLLEHNNEAIMKKDEFAGLVSNFCDYDELTADFEFIGDEVRKIERASYIGAISKFLLEWQGPDEGFARILSRIQSKKGIILSLSYRCLDPAIVTRDIFNEVHCSVLMSGTLSPAEMYRDVLGLPKNAILKNFKNPFPKKNRLYLVVPDTSTKMAKRNDIQYQRIAQISASICNSVPGNTAVFFPSYKLQLDINRYFNELSTKTIFSEKQGLTKTERTEMLASFAKYKNAVLLCVAHGSYSEGIDLPNVLKCIVVVGIPLNQPDLETRELIQYYDKKYGRGWDYGYIIPAMNKTIQAAGRAIRSEKDRAVMVFLDERYCQENYFKCFPPDWDIKITKQPVERIKEFFDLFS